MYKLVSSDKSLSLTSSSALQQFHDSVLFHWLFLHSDSETTENMFLIQPYCPGTRAFCIYNTLGWWQLFRCWCGLNTLTMKIVPSSPFLGTSQSALALQTAGIHSKGQVSRKGYCKKPTVSRSSLLLYTGEISTHMVSDFCLMAGSQAW